MNEVLLDIIMQLVLLAAGTLAAVAVALIQKKLGLENLRRIDAELITKRDIVDTAVLFVQQVYRALDGPQKYSLAVERASELLEQHKLIVSPEELQSLIEASVKVLKNEFGDAWNNAVYPGDGDDTPKEPKTPEKLEAPTE